MALEDRHLNQDFADPEKRAEGWRLMMRAKRIARRLGWTSLMGLGVDL